MSGSMAWMGDFLAEGFQAPDEDPLLPTREGRALNRYTSARSSPSTPMRQPPAARR